MKISCVLPSRNGARYLKESIESVLTQTFKDWELILIDDASTDETPSIMKEYAQRDPRIRFFSNPKNLKLPLSLNHGFQHARAPYFTWTSDDNLYHPTALEKMLAMLESGQADLVYADMEQIDEHGQVKERLSMRPLEEIWKESPVGACFLYKREVHEALGGYSDAYRLAEDYDFWLRAAARFKFVHLPEVLYQYRLHPGGLTLSRWNEIAAVADRTLEDNLPQLTWMRPQTRAEARFRLIMLGLKRGDWRQVARQVLPLLKLFPISLFVGVRKALRPFF